MLGSEAVVEQLRQRVQGRPQADEPQWRALQSHGTMEEHLGRYQLTPEVDSMPIRRRERPLRDMPMYLLR